MSLTEKYSLSSKVQCWFQRIKWKREVATDTTEIYRIIRDYYKQLYANKMDNLEKMDKFLEKYSLPKLNQEEIENMNILISSNEIE